MSHVKSKYWFQQPLASDVTFAPRVQPGLPLLTELLLSPSPYFWSPQSRCGFQLLDLFTSLAPTSLLDHLFSCSCGCDRDRWGCVCYSFGVASGEWARLVERKAGGGECGEGDGWLERKAGRVSCILWAQRHHWCPPAPPARRIWASVLSPKRFFSPPGSLLPLTENHGFQVSCCRSARSGSLKMLFLILALPLTRPQAKWHFSVSGFATCILWDIYVCIYIIYMYVIYISWNMCLVLALNWRM